MKRYHIPQLGPDPASPFPAPGQSNHPEGLVAWGGDLNSARLINGYRQGIFPWYEHGSPILWWSPEPRAVLIPGAWTPPRRLCRTLRQGRFEVHLDQNFAAVVDACAGPRSGQTGTWITPAMHRAYCELHRLGHAHSFEIHDGGQLIGGLYGVAIGKIFFAESKFHFRRDASKLALAVMMRCLQSWEFLLADCQIWNPHLERLGVRLMTGAEFRQVLAAGIDRPDQIGSWQARKSDVNLADW
ncbi:MAG: leucyl/phenylalanyl-tRNA--protein transferase [Wenzhouxiangella sp.]|nr:leucyl/phenylalanyl-tRNA--protein transferase [Wenzhouxiangella sp.]MCH8478129.1 leucyl/phenylalanyl-tRNA--protein transferase [Wenzhouxiangella sp.]TVR97044.1 MAG: leucyl/phenylalanyl-tRNA--protein transferase [Wenzhouxiangellaceae bacterium]